MDNLDIFNLNLLPTVIWHHLAADPLEKLRFLLVKFFSHKSDSRIAIVHLSVCLSVSRSPKPLSLKESCLSAKSQPISHHTNQPSYQSAIMPISHHATQPPYPPLSASQNYNYWPKCISAIMPLWPPDLCPAFATFRTFQLVSILFKFFQGEISNKFLQQQQHFS